MDQGVDITQEPLQQIRNGLVTTCLLCGLMTTKGFAVLVVVVVNRSL